MCWYMSMSDQRTGTGATNPTLNSTIPLPLVRVMRRICRAATDSVARSFSPLSWISVSVRRARSTRDALMCSHSAIFSSPLSSGSPTASTSKHNDRSEA